MRVNLKIANVAKETGALLTEYLEDRGLIIDRGAPISISYGVPSSQRRALNDQCGGGDKIRRLKQFENGGVRTIPWFEGVKVPGGFRFPALARRQAGHGGEDIVPVFQAQEVPWRIKAGWDWFSSYVPTITEYRVWIFRDECLDVYEKVMRRPEDYKYVAGRNFRMGFDFERIPQPSKATIQEAIKTVRAVSFDFGAVDMLLGEDNLFYVLECNTAPGVIKSGAQATLGKLADKMVGWVKEGCPERGY